MGKNIITNLNEWEKSNESGHFYPSPKDMNHKDMNRDYLEIGDLVQVPEPNKTGDEDSWDEPFAGRITMFDGEYAEVEDIGLPLNKKNKIYIDPNRLELIEKGDEPEPEDED